MNLKAPVASEMSVAAKLRAMVQAHMQPFVRSGCDGRASNGITSDRA